MDQKFKCKCGVLFTRKSNLQRHKKEKTHAECEEEEARPLPLSWNRAVQSPHEDGFRRDCYCIETNQNENTKKKAIDPGLLWEAFQEKDGYGLFYDIMNPKSTTKKRKTETESSLEPKEKKSFDEDGFLIDMIGHPPPPAPKNSDSTTKFDEIESGEEELEDLEEAIKDTIEFLTKEKREELKSLLKDFKKSGNLEVVLKMETLLPKFFAEEYLDNTRYNSSFHIGTMLRAYLEKLNNTSMESKIKHTRFRILLSDFDEIRRRIQTIHTQLDEADDDEELSQAVDYLRTKDLISFQQWQKLKDEDNAHYPEKIVEILTLKE